jgi:hypothetical protein
LQVTKSLTMCYRRFTSESKEQKFKKTITKYDNKNC